MDQTSSRDDFIKVLRDALNHLQDPVFLRRSPLANAFGIGQQFDRFSTLQTILTDTIRALEPADDEPPRSRAWRTYDCLYYRYVQQFTQQEVADQIGISTRQLQREQQAAFEHLADQLWLQLAVDAFDVRPSVAAPSADTSAIDSTVAEELAWLSDVSTKGQTDLHQLLPEVIDLARPMAERHGVGFDVQIEDGLSVLAANAVALNQTLLNLLTVVIHRNEGSAYRERLIRVVASEIPQGCQIRVDCVGGAEIAVGTLADDESSLAMAYQLAELSGGRLAIHDEDGAFAATLTLQAIAQTPVLVIDDNEDALRLMQRYVSGTPYRLIDTSSVDRVVDLVREHEPRVIVLDVMMPDISGWTVLEMLRNHPLTQEIPVIMCTILPQEELAESLGASGYIRKPVTRQAFLEALNRLVAQMAPISR